MKACYCLGVVRVMNLHKMAQGTCVNFGVQKAGTTGNMVHDQFPPMFLYSLSVGFMIMLSCSANHLCVCHQCISGITGLFVCAILSSISVPARRTHSHFYSPSTRSYTVYCSLVALSLSLACCSRTILSPSFSTLSTVSSCPWYLIMY